MRERVWGAVAWYAVGAVISLVIVWSTEPMARVKTVYYVGKVLQGIASIAGKGGIVAEDRYYKMMEAAKL